MSLLLLLLLLSRLLIPSVVSGNTGTTAENWARARTNTHRTHRRLAAGTSYSCRVLPGAKRGDGCRS
uniref:Putative secreted peptide n=1 Tax=Anopheles braziliensis TaxID=58242 RepID=A0A2M3ZS95_9DIPT